MNCHVCGAPMTVTVTDLPFKVSDHSIVIVKDIPVTQCTNCHEYLLDDAVMKHVDELLVRVGADTKLEIVRYAA